MIHLVTDAHTPSRTKRLSVCFAAICRPGGDNRFDEDSGLPFASGTKDLTGVTCPACLAAAANVPVYRAQVLSSGEWETVAAFLDFEPARFRAEAERGDGYKSRVKQPAVWAVEPRCLGCEGEHGSHYAECPVVSRRAS